MACFVAMVPYTTNWQMTNDNNASDIERTVLKTRMLFVGLRSHSLVLSYSRTDGQNKHQRISKIDGQVRAFNIGLCGFWGSFVFVPDPGWDTYVSCIPHKIGTCQKISGHARSGCRPSVISDVSWCSYVYVWRVVIKVFRFVYHYKMSFLRWSSSTVRTVHSTYGYGSSTHNDMEMQISSTVLYASTT